MTKIQKTFISILVTIVLSLTLAPAVFAEECDHDGDGYIALSQDMLEVAVEDNAFKADGNYSPAQWAKIFETYKNKVTADSSLDERYVCNSINFKNGAEPSRCDEIWAKSDSGIFDTSKVTTQITGAEVNPGAFDTPDNGIDENCDGADGEMLSQPPIAQKDLGKLVDRAISLLSKAVAVVSIVVLIWGAILYTTAAGDENKTAKARKAIIGAVIGLAVGLLAPSVVAWVIASLA